VTVHEEAFLQMKIFQSTQRSIQNNLATQVGYVCKQVVDPYFMITKAGSEATSANAGLSV